MTNPHSRIRPFGSEVLRTAVIVSCGICTVSCIEAAERLVEKTSSEIADLSASELQDADLLEISIACTKGLPGSGNYTPNRICTTAESWLGIIQGETAKLLETLKASPGKTDRSEERCKAEALFYAVRDTLKVNYQPAQLPDGSLQATIDEGYRLDSRYLFPSEVFESDGKATCVSLPMLYLVLGRRLGYPVKLAIADGHLLLRWDGTEKFDFDLQSFHAPLDLRERAGETPLLPPARKLIRDLAPGAVLLSKQDEISMLFHSRGACFESFGMNDDALVAYAQAYRISPNCTNHAKAIAHIMPKITNFFRHTAPMLAPDYSQRIDFVLEEQRVRSEWDRKEQEFRMSLPPAKTPEEQTSQLQLRREFDRGRTEALNELRVREAWQDRLRTSNQPTP